MLSFKKVMIMSTDHLNFSLKEISLKIKNSSKFKIESLQFSDSDCALDESLKLFQQQEVDPPSLFEIDYIFIVSNARIEFFPIHVCFPKLSATVNMLSFWSLPLLFQKV